jgi:cell wall-associated NlpC family hydrolase
MTGTRTRALRSPRHLLSAAVAVVALVATTTAPADAHSFDRASSERRHVKRRARSQLGTDYTYGGSSPSSGFDCSGFTRWTFRNHGAALPHSSMEQFRLAGENGNIRIRKRRNLQIGDLVFHKTTSERVGHAGIYVGRGKFISSTSSGGVRRRSIWDPYYWGPRWVGATRLRVTRKGVSRSPSRQGATRIPSQPMGARLEQW